MTIISRSHVVETVVYCREYVNADGIGGYSFDCDANGIVDKDSLAPEALENYLRCENGTDGIKFVEVAEYRNRYREPMVIKCYCGQELEVPEFTNKCDCGRFYNSFGQELCHPSNWGEDTGERFSDEGQYIGGGEDD